MQKNIKVISLILIIFLISCNALLSGSKTAELYFHRGLDSYLKGDIDSAIDNVEEALEFDKKNKKMEAFLVKILAERSSQLFSNKQFKDALPYLEKAKMLDPENEDVKRMYDIVYQQLHPAAVEVPFREVPSRVEVERETVMSSLLAQLQRQQEKLMEAYAREKSIKEQKKVSPDTFIYGIGGGLATIIIIIFLMMKMSERREQILIDQQTKVLDMVQQQSTALAQGATQLRPTYTPSQEGQITPREMLNDPNSRVRTKGLELIESTLVGGKEDAEVAERLLSPFVNEKDNRVRAIALKILHRFNSKKAMKGINKMIKSDDKWMRISAAWILGEITPVSEIVEMLLSNMNDKDYHFKRRVVKSLKDILLKKKIDRKLGEKIHKALEELQMKEHWVV